MEDHQGEYPVINIDLKDAQGDDFKETLEMVYD